MEGPAVVPAKVGVEAAVEAISGLGVDIRQIITIVTVNEDDTALAVVAIPGAEGPEAVVNTLLTHTKLAVEGLGGTMQVLLPPDINQG